MKKILFSLLSLVLLVGFRASKPEVKPYTIEQFMKTVRIGGGTFSYDEKMLLVGSNQTGIFNAYSLSVNGGALKAITESKNSAFTPISFFPKDNRVLYSADNNGNEVSHIFLDEKGKVTDLTPEPQAKAQFYGWSDDKKSFFYGSTKRDKRFFDVYEMDITTMKSVLLFENTEGYYFDAITPDKHTLALHKSITKDIAELFLYEVSAKKLTKISDKEGLYNAQDFDENYLYYLTDVNSEYQYLMKYELKTGFREKVWQEKWDIQYAKFSEKKRYMVLGINNDAKNVIKIFDRKAGATIDVPKFEDGDVAYVNISPSETKMTLGIGSSTSPNNLYFYDFATKKVSKLTNSMNPEIDPKDLVSASIVRFKSFDGLEIPAILYAPKQASPQSKVPALIWVHGGPGGQTRIGWSEQIQFLVNHGYAILAVNNRGSSGYGKSFYKMDDKNHGEKDLQDCIFGKNYLASLSWIDADKIGIYGGSYGGFIVMSALTSTPKEFKVGVNLFGVTNWLRTLKSIPPWWEAQRKSLYEELGDPTSSDSVRLRAISPLFNASKIERPVIILQGSQDPRVLQVESDEMVAAARKKGVPVEYVLFPDEGHGFVKKDNQIKSAKAVLGFLDKYLKNEMAN